MQKHLFKRELFILALILLFSTSMKMEAETISFDPLTIFTDKSCSELKKGVKQKDVNKISDAFYKEMATAILNKTYDQTGFRIQTYRPYQDPKIKEVENLTAPYSLRDNPTGIYLPTEGEALNVFVSHIPAGESIELLIEEKRLKKEDPRTRPLRIALQEGRNEINTVGTGMLYILYHVQSNVPLIVKSEKDRKHIEELSVKINIQGGKVNGYYDTKKNTPADWKKFLAYESGARTFDVLSERVHISWVKEVYREKVEDPTHIMAYWDTILMLQQNFLGLEKYSSEGGLATDGKPNRLFQNRMFLDVSPGNPGASSNKITFPHNTGYDELFVDVDRLKARLWGPAHEIGHMNQVRPGFNWGGMIETTNNIFCLYNQHVLGQMTRLEDDDYYGKAKEKIMDAYEADPTRMDLGFSGIKGDFEKIVPYWQLYLYTKLNGYEDFYKDLFEQYRIIRLDLPGVDPTQINSPKKDHGIVQTEFVKMACETLQLDLTEFFVKWGFLREADMHFNQYIDRHLVVTKERVEEVKEWIKAKNYPKPTVKLWEINDQNYTSYKDNNLKAR